MQECIYMYIEKNRMNLLYKGNVINLFKQNIEYLAKWNYKKNYKKKRAIALWPRRIL